jgi:CRP-like cAMP-binding protein
VTQGALCAVVPDKEGRLHEIARLPEGAVFGEMFCIDPAPRPVTLVASTATQVLELGRDALISMRQQAPHVAAALVSAVFLDVLQRLRNVEDRIGREIDAERLREESSPAAARPSSLPSPWQGCFASLRGSA